MDENGAWRELLRLSLAVPDARGDRGKRHDLSETLFLIVSGMLADWQDALDIVDFGRDHRDRLEQFLEFVHGIPSHGACWICRSLRSEANPARPHALLAFFAPQAVLRGLSSPGGGRRLAGFLESVPRW